MNKIILGIVSAVLLLSVFSFASVAVLAQESASTDTETDASLSIPANETAKPSGLGRALERLDLLLTFDKAKKAEKGLAHAQRRLLELRTLLEEKKLDQAEKARLRYESKLREVEGNIEDIKDDKNPEKELDSKLRLESKLLTQEDRLERLESEIELRVNGNLTEEQLGAIATLVASLKNNTGKLRIKMELEQGNAKARIKIKLGNDNEAEKFLNESRERHNLTKGYIKASEAAIARAEEIISKAEIKLDEAKASNASKVNLDKAYELLAESKDSLEQAKNASANGEYQLSIRLANKASANVLRFVHARIVFGEKQLEKAVERAEKAKERLEELEEKADERKTEIAKKLAERKTELAKKRVANESSDDDSEDKNKTA